MGSTGYIQCTALPVPSTGTVNASYCSGFTLPPTTTMPPPFVFTGACTLVEVTVDVSHFIPTGLPFCSVPPFTQPTMVPREPEILVPQVMPAHVCDCITFETMTFKKAGYAPGNKPQMKVEIVRVNSDCCDQIFDVTVDNSFVCSPSIITGTSNIHEGSKLSMNFNMEMKAPTGGTSVTLPSGTIVGTGTQYCCLSYNLDIAVPAFEFDCNQLSANVFPSVRVGNTARITAHAGFKPTYGISGTQYCIFSCDIGLTIPAFSVVINDINVNGPGDFDVTMYVMDYILYASFYISFPPIPSFPSFGGLSCGDLIAAPVGKHKGGDGSFNLTAYFGASCTLNISYYISFPAFSGITCGDLMVAPVGGTPVGPGNFDLSMWFGSNCTLHASYVFSLPNQITGPRGSRGPTGPQGSQGIPGSCCGFSCGALTVAQLGSWHNEGCPGHFELSLWYGLSCTLHGSFNISFPPYPTGFSCGYLTFNHAKCNPTWGNVNSGWLYDEVCGSRCILQHQPKSWAVVDPHLIKFNRLTYFDGFTCQEHGTLIGKQHINEFDFDQTFGHLFTLTRHTCDPVILFNMNDCITCDLQGLTIRGGGAVGVSKFSVDCRRDYRLSVYVPPPTPRFSCGDIQAGSHIHITPANGTGPCVIGASWPQPFQCSDLMYCSLGNMTPHLCSHIAMDCPNIISMNNLCVEINEHCNLVSRGEAMSCGDLAQGRLISIANCNIGHACANFYSGILNVPRVDVYPTKLGGASAVQIFGFHINNDNFQLTMDCGHIQAGAHNVPGPDQNFFITVPQLRSCCDIYQCFTHGTFITMWCNTAGIGIEHKCSGLLDTVVDFYEVFELVCSYQAITGHGYVVKQIRSLQRRVYFEVECGHIKKISLGNTETYACIPG